MLINPAPLAETAAGLRSGKIDLLKYIDNIHDLFQRIEPEIHAFLPEPNRYERLKVDATALIKKYPDPIERPPLFGILFGLKDIFYADGFPTKAGSKLPSELFKSPQASCVTKLYKAGALIIGKTVTAEFAYIAPGPTRNPHNLKHTPGGSSSGSAAAVAAGLCSLALGTQTVGSVIRPAAFCGIVGFKPSYGRIPTDGLIPFSESVDHVGLFTQDIAGMNLAASCLCTKWSENNQSVEKPVLGVPEGPYLDQASSEAIKAFQAELELLKSAGYLIKHVSTFDDIDLINTRHHQMIAAEIAKSHSERFSLYKELYHSSTAELIHKGQKVEHKALTEARAGREKLRHKLHTLMEERSIDLWICPAAPGPAPEGLESTGNSIMNLPWTYSGLPVVSLNAGSAGNGLPLGLQCVSAFMKDEQLLNWAGQLKKKSKKLLDIC